MYVHLLGRCEHSDKCKQRRCAPDCGYAEFDRWLNTPLFRADVLAAERVAERRAVLLSGEIPA